MKNVIKTANDGITTWTDDVKENMNEIEDVLRPLFKKYIEDGYDSNQIAYMIGQVTLSIDLENMIGL